MIKKLCAFIGVVAVLLLAPRATAAETTWIYAVQVSASVDASAPRITLNWPADHLPISHYVVQRRAPGEAAWGEGVTLPGDATSFTDDNVAAGNTYEYQIVKRGATFVYTGYGYISVGVNAPLVDQRGRVILVVDQSVAGPLAGELERLRLDLIGDGWIVARRDVDRGDSPAAVKAQIRAEYEADRGRTKAVLLIGRVPVVRSGNFNVDGHGARPMPADVFYAEMDGEWTDANNDGIYDQSVLPSDVDLQIGRIDFADLPGKYAAGSYPGEVDLLRRYLDKDNAYRQARTRITPRAIVANATGDGNGQAQAASGYRNFAALVGHDRIRTVAAEITSPAEERWLAHTTRDDYLWSFGSGAGSDLSVANLGSHGASSDLWATDFVDLKPKVTFQLFFGSWFSDWTQPDNLLRSALAAPDYGLASAWSGRPHLFFHSMGSGETIGHGIRASQNNDGRNYQNHVQRQLRGVHIALLGDPTLRLHVIAPPTEVTAAPAGSDLLVSWKASADPVLGYHVYRVTDGSGSVVRITENPTTDTRFADAGRAGENGTYYVRAVALQNGPSGSYVNASQGAFATVGSNSNSAASNPRETPGNASGGTRSPVDVAWFDDTLPPGAVPFEINDRWNWVPGVPAPASGSLAHLSDLAPGVHLHFFAFATTPLVVNSGDTLYAYIFIDPANVPRQIMLSWLTDNWEHRAYWGENLIAEGIDNSAGRRHMGPIPPTGRWVRLEVPASAVGLEGRSATGMGFTLFDGRASWDRAGKTSP